MRNIKRKGYRWIHIVGMLLILVLVCTWAVSVGSAELSVWDSWKIAASRLPVIGQHIHIEEIGSKFEVIVWKIRMPRILLSGLVGGALALVGATYQGVFHNSLADPHILGVSSGAALGATIAMLAQNAWGVSVQILGLGTIGVFAFIGAMLTVALVYFIAQTGGKISATTMLLTGTAVSTLLSSGISLLMTFHNDQIEKIYLWTMGSFTSASWSKVGFMAVFTLAGSVGLLLHARKLNIMMLGEEEAQTLGVDAVRLRRRLIVIASLLVAAAVSVSGVIGFVGLIIPHCVRLLLGADNRFVMSLGVFFGAVFLIVCDTIARTVAAPTEIPVGIITAVCGVPFFLFLIYRQRRGSVI